MPRNALIFGHSHVWSLKRAIIGKTYVPQNADYSTEVILCGTREFPGPLVSTGMNGYMAINACLIASLSHIQPGPDNWLVSTVQGNYYNIVAMIEPDPPFDFVIPWAANLPRIESAEFVPYPLVKSMIRQQTEELELLLQQLPKLGYPNIVHINAPPPVESAEYIEKDLIQKKAFNPATDKVTPASVRLKLWLTQCEVMNELCNAVGAICLNAPDSTRTERGFLKQEYWKDAVHANEHYSAVMLTELERLIMSGGPSNG